MIVKVQLKEKHMIIVKAVKDVVMDQHLAIVKDVAMDQ